MIHSTQLILSMNPGSVGYVGSLVLEQLLRLCPGINKVGCLNSSIILKR